MQVVEGNLEFLRLAMSISIYSLLVVWSDDCIICSLSAVAYILYYQVLFMQTTFKHCMIVPFLLKVITLFLCLFAFHLIFFFWKSLNI